MKLTAIATTAALSLFATSACGKKDKTEGGKSGSAKAAPAKLAPATIPSLSLALEVPSDANVSDNTKTAGFPSATIYANPTIFVTGQNEMFWKKDVAAQKAEIQKSPGNKFKKFTKEETTADGFHLEWDSESMTGSTLKSFHVRKTINGKQFDCNSNTQSDDERAAGVKYCQSLRAK